MGHDEMQSVLENLYFGQKSNFLSQEMQIFDQKVLKIAFFFHNSNDFQFFFEFLKNCFRNLYEQKIGQK